MRDGPRRFSRDSTCPAILRNLPSEPARFRLPGSHRPWPVVPDRSTNALVCDSPTRRSGRPYNPAVHARRFGLVRVRSPLLTESLLFSVPAGTEMVHFPALSSMAYVFSHGYLGINRGGFPHSEISGSTPVCGSPKLIAACHVLHRLLAPRHPPYALSSLTFNPRNRCRRRFESGRTRPEEPDATGTLDTLRVWSEKTTVCRIFSCQRTAGGARPAVCGPPALPSPAEPTNRPGVVQPAAPARGNNSGGEYRARTGDLLVANQALSQLS